MSDVLPSLNGPGETERIVTFLKDIFVRTKKKNAVIGWSGGIDSTVSLYLLARAIPPENIHVFHMPHDISNMNVLHSIRKELKLPGKNVAEYPIKPIVEAFRSQASVKSASDRVRLGNIMARTRMILLFDQARALDGLVCGTENRSEHLLGYFTRYGDGASDIEPIQHLFKTQVYQLAAYLGVPESIIQAPPTAGLWEGQTDEGEFGFTYRQADEVLYQAVVLKKSSSEIGKMGYANAGAILDFMRKNDFKLEVPYTLAE